MSHVGFDLEPVRRYYEDDRPENDHNRDWI